MSSRRHTTRQGLTLAVIEQWDKINPLSIPDENNRNIFQSRVSAILLYAQNESGVNIKSQTGICRQEVDRFVKRTLVIMPDGNMAGYRALIPYSQNVALRKSDLHLLKSRTPKPGALTALFRKYPAIYKSMKDAAIDGIREGIKAKEHDMPVSVLYLYFIELCEKAGIQSPHYPFVDSAEEPVGRSAIRRWTNKVRTENALRRMRSSNTEADIQATQGVGPDITSLKPAYRLFQRVEFDGHKIDAPFALEVLDPKGEGVKLILVGRIWIIAGVEAKIGAVLGYSLAIGINYSSRDLVRAIQNTLKPWRKRNLTVSTVDYGPGDGIPNGLIPELTYACCDEIALDNAMAHRADYLMSYVERTTQSVPVWSPVAAPNTHPYAEGFFNLLEELGIHRMQTTTGSNPKDARRQKSLDGRYLLSYELLEDLVDLLVCRINGYKPNELDDSKIEKLQKAVQRRSFLVRHVPVEQRDYLMKFDICEPGVIGRDHGKPVIRFERARYHNKTLRLAMNLIGQRITIFASSKNLQTIEVSLEDGTFLGEMRCEPRWADTPHSLDVRREINRQLSKGEFVASGDNIVFGFNEHLEKTAANSKRAARWLARMRKEKVESNYSSQPIQDSDDIDDIHADNLISDNDSEIDDDELSAEELARLTKVFHR
jgi:hypothetical protein